MKIELNSNNTIINHNLSNEEKLKLKGLREIGILKTAADDGVDFMNAEYVYTLSEYTFKIEKDGNREWLKAVP